MMASGIATCNIAIHAGVVSLLTSPAFETRLTIINFVFP